MSILEWILGLGRSKPEPAPDMVGIRKLSQPEVDQMMRGAANMAWQQRMQENYPVIDADVVPIDWEMEKQREREFARQGRTYRPPVPNPDALQTANRLDRRYQEIQAHRRKRGSGPPR